MRRWRSTTRTSGSAPGGKAYLEDTRGTEGPAGARKWTDSPEDSGMRSTGGEFARSTIACGTPAPFGLSFVTRSIKYKPRIILNTLRGWPQIELLDSAGRACLD